MEKVEGGMEMRILTHISLFAGASVIAASSALAQVGPEQPASEAAAPEAGASDDDGAIVVTAQRRAQRLQDIPVSVSVTTGEALQQANLLNLESLSARLPSVRISPAPVSDFIAVRGVGSSLNFGFEQSVGTFVDGIYRGRSRSTRAAMFDVERVEVLRGPQTTFFGNNAIAGAFNITTRRPSRDFETNALAFYAPDTREYTLEAGVCEARGRGAAARGSRRAMTKKGGRVSRMTLPEIRKVDFGAEMTVLAPKQ